jgi:hypothetical protein
MGRQLRDILPKIQGSFISDGNPLDPASSPEEYFAGLSDFDKEFFNRHNLTHFTGFMKSEPLPRPDFFPLWGNDPPSGSDAHEFSRSTGMTAGIDKDHIIPLITNSPAEFEERWEAYLSAIDAIPAHLMAAHLAYYTEIAERKLAAAGG